MTTHALDLQIPSAFVSPDWDCNIWTLVQAIVNPEQYKTGPLSSLQTALQNDIVVLCVVDGMTLEGARSCPELRANLREDIRLTSLAPSATATVLTSILTGAPPRIHGALGWIIWCPELGEQILSLPFMTLAGQPLPKGTVPEDLFYGGPSTFEKMADQRQCFRVTPREIANSPTLMAAGRGAKSFPYRDLRYMCEAVEWIARHQNVPTFVYAYTDLLDTQQHRSGLAHIDTRTLLNSMAGEFARLTSSLAGKKVSLVITSDHGFYETPPEQAVLMADHPELAAMCKRNLSGEKRFAYCHLREGVEDRFLDYVNNRLGGSFFPIRSNSAYADALFGPGSWPAMFRQRIGDYILASVGDAWIQDPLPGAPYDAYRGHHGSLLPEEMMIPLIVFQH